MTEEKIKRINELYHKAKTLGLSDEEKAEQAVLRKEFIASIRSSVQAQLNNMDIQNEDGSIENLGEKYGNRNSGS